MRKTRSRVLFGITLASLLAGVVANVSASVLSVDINQNTNTGVTQPGFTGVAAFDLAGSPPSETFAVGAYSVTLWSENNSTLFARDRNPTFPGGYTEGLLTRDFIRTNGGDLDLTVAGLLPNTLYDIKFWSVDSAAPGGGGAASSNRWYLGTVATGTPFAIYTQPGVTPAVDGEDTLKTRFATDGTGQAIFGIQALTGFNMLNAFEVTNIPEPATVLLLGLGGLVVRASRRGRR